jgi:hypothetical protein
MRRLIPSLAAVLFTLLVCDAALAQRMRTRVVSGPPGTRVVRVSPQGTLSDPNLALTSPVVPSGNTVDSLINGGYPAPGLGFDFTHHAAVNRNLGVRALVDPITQHRLALARQIRRETPVTPITGPIVINSIQVNVLPQPPVVIIQEPEPEPVDRLENARYAERVAEAPQPPPVFYEPEQDTSELVFIRRDGSLLFAVAFVTRGERLVYVTRDGQRRSLALADLDLDATRDINEARGASLQL